MDVSAINSNNISGLNNSSSLQLERSSASQKIGDSKKDALNLNISNYNKRRDELSLDVQSLNDGIAITKIATNAIEKQQNYLKNIDEKLSNIENFKDKNEIKQSINEDLRGFNQVAYETRYKREALLVNDYYDDKTSIDISTSATSFSIPKPNTASIANEIFETSNSSDLNNPAKLEELTNKVSSSSNLLKNTYELFTDLGNKLEESAQNSIKTQIDLYNENKMSKDINFGKESSDFSKANIIANSGYLAASQANIVQAQSVRVLS